MKKYLLLFLFGLAWGKTTIVINLENHGLKDSEIRILTERLQSEFVKISGYTIVERKKIDGIDIRDLTLESLRNRMGIVTQETIFFDEKIEFNNICGCGDYTSEELESSAKAANLYNFILEQSNEFKTIIGERGKKLSNGQRQKLSISRTILRNSPILILDEATPLLDTESERKVQNALENLIRERTTIVITHRLSTIQRVNSIIVLDKGKLGETGNHNSLIKKDGLYAQLNKFILNA